MRIRQGRRGSDVIVIHPGSRFTRIGRACDINPVTVPTVIARKSRDSGGTVPEPRYVRGIERPQPGMERTRPVQGSGGGDEYSVSSQSNDPVSGWISSRLSSPPYPAVYSRSFHMNSLGSILSIKGSRLIASIASHVLDSLKSRLIRLSRASGNG